MAGALEGIRVVDFGHYIAGPLAGMLLADQGADVVKIDPPGGPRWQTPGNATWNRGKRSITLDLKDEADLDTARRLVASADVLVENFRPGVMDRLGLGAEAMIEANPRLVYCSIPGFAADDPRAGVAAWEGVLGAATATYTTAGDGLASADNPVLTAVPISSSYGAFVGVVSIAMALNARERDGAGQRIEVPLFDATFTAIGSRGLYVHDPSRRAPERADGWVRQYECSDGRWVQFHAANQRFIERFIDRAGLGAWREEGLHVSEEVAEDPDLSAELLRRMTALFKTRTAKEWEDLVNDALVCCSIVYESSEWMQHEHARTSKQVIEVEDPEYGTMLQPGVNPRLYGAPGAVRRGASAPGADRAEVLGPWLEAAPEPASPPETRLLRSALEGLKVLDLCIILAGPTCGRTLAEFGADVVKIDDPNRAGGVRMHNDVNRGKQSMLLDLKTEEGRELFWKLAEEADVVVQNLRGGRIDVLGLDYEELKKRNPSVVYASINAYGHEAPWEERPGWEQLAQAAAGMQARFAGDRPYRQAFPINDYGTGLMGAYGVALALLHRQRTGEGQHVKAALAYTACTLQSPFFQDYEGKVWDEVRGHDALGWNPLQHLYRASDRWLFLGATPDLLPAIGEIAGLEGAAGLEGDALEAFLAERIAQRPAEEWAERLTALGAGAHPVRGVRELMTDEWVQEHGLSITREHAEIGLVTTNGPSPRLSRTPAEPGAPASKPGTDARAVLEARGLAEDYERLLAAGVIAIDGVVAS